eukprot:gene2513-3219_t
MNIVSKISVRNKRFDSKGKLLLPQKENIDEIQHKSISEVCRYETFPLNNVLKLVRKYKEAKAIADCLIFSNKMKKLWPTLLLSFVSYQIHLKIFNEENAKMKLFLLQSENRCVYSCIKSSGFEQRNTIRSLISEYEECIKKFEYILMNLQNYTEINQGIANELTEANFLAENKIYLYKLEKVLCNRVEWIVKGFPNKYQLIILNNWDSIKLLEDSFLEQLTNQHEVLEISDTEEEETESHHSNFTKKEENIQQDNDDFDIDNSQPLTQITPNKQLTQSQKSSLRSVEEIPGERIQEISEFVEVKKNSKVSLTPEIVELTDEPMVQTPSRKRMRSPKIETNKKKKKSSGDQIPEILDEIL